MMRTHRSKFDYFIDALKHQPEDESLCIEWPFKLTHHGYGYLWGGGFNWIMTHRLAYILYRGSIPSGRMCVCHHCDNKKCYRPSHLFLGTDADNIQDCIRKGRRVDPPRYGEYGTNRKLTEAQVREMNALYLSGMNKDDVAKQFGITTAHLSAISKRKAWSHLIDLSWNGIKRKLSEQHIREMNALFHAGMPQVEIARRFGIDRSCMWLIIAGKTWAHLTDLSWKR